MKKILFAGVLILAGCQAAPQYDVVIRGGTVYDGSGSEPVQADIAILDSKIAAVGDLEAAVGKTEVDVTGLAVAPGFINMLSWATESLILDGRSQSDIRQGVTLEVFGEGRSMGPLNEAMKSQTRESQPEDARYEINWTTLGEYLESSGGPGGFDQRGLLCGSNHDPGSRIGLRESPSDTGGTATNAAISRPGNGRRGNGSRLLLDLRSSLLRPNRRVDCPLPNCRRIWRHVHLAHAKRGGSISGKLSTS